MAGLIDNIVGTYNYYLNDLSGIYNIIIVIHEIVAYF